MLSLMELIFYIALMCLCRWGWLSEGGVVASKTVGHCSASGLEGKAKQGKDRVRRDIQRYREAGSPAPASCE
jgi:hypothetical protein